MLTYELSFLKVYVDSGDISKAKRSESKTKKPKARSQPKAKPQPRRKLHKTRRELTKEIRKTVQKVKKERQDRLKAEKEKKRLLDELDFQRADRATQVNKIVSGKSVKELRRFAKIYNVKGRSKAKTKDDLILLLDENYAERKQAAYERRVGAWESEIRANEEIFRWQREILEEERRRRLNEPARPKLIKEAMNGRVQNWFVDGSEYKDPDVFLYD